jgi:hypothetical protein
MERGSDASPLSPTPGPKPGGSWITLALFFGAALAAMVLLNFLTLGFITPFFVLGAAIFAIIGLQYLVWGWWFERIYRAPYLAAQAEEARRRAAGAGSGKSAVAEVRWDLTRVFPYVVTEASLDTRALAPHGLAVPLGHALAIVLVHEQGGSCRAVEAEDLGSMRLSAAELHRQAQDNLVSVAEHPQIAKRLYRADDGLAYWVWSGHWLVASCVHLPQLYAQARERLNAARLLVSLPRRETMVIFPEGDRASRERMRGLIRRQHGDPSPDELPLTWELFALTPAGVTPFFEP